MAGVGFRRILVVCTGNICRSPIAEVLFKQRLAEVERAVVESAGIGALVGAPADPHAVTVTSELGYDLAAHRGRQLDLELAGRFELVLVMENHQKAWIEQRYPVLRGRVHLLGRWLGEEIADPYREPIERFRAARLQIERAVDSWMEKL